MNQKSIILRRVRTTVRMTVPRDYAEAYGYQEGDVVIFTPLDENTVTLKFQKMKALAEAKVA